jgi:hypothetical protein
MTKTRLDSTNSKVNGVSARGSCQRGLSQCRSGRRTPTQLGLKAVLPADEEEMYWLS